MTDSLVSAGVAQVLAELELADNATPTEAIRAIRQLKQRVQHGDATCSTLSSLNNQLYREIEVLRDERDTALSDIEHLKSGGRWI